MFLAVIIPIMKLKAVPSSKSCPINIYICPSLYSLLVQIRVTLDRTLLCIRSNVKLEETQCFITPFSQAPFTCASQFIPNWSNVELCSTELYFVPGPMSSSERHMFPIYGPL